MRAPRVLDDKCWFFSITVNRGDRGPSSAARARHIAPHTVVPRAANFNPPLLVGLSLGRALPTTESPCHVIRLVLRLLVLVEVELEGVAHLLVIDLELPGAVAPTNVGVGNLVQWSRGLLAANELCAIDCQLNTPPRKISIDRLIGLSIWQRNSDDALLCTIHPMESQQLHPAKVLIADWAYHSLFP